MRELHVVALSEDGRSVLLATTRDATRGGFRVALDERLAAAVRGDLPRPGEQEVRDSALTPKEIQARLRAGASPEQIARDAGVAVARVERFSGPVLSERAGIIDAARAAHLVRGRLGRSVLPLGEAVTAALEGSSGFRADSEEWSTRREEDGSWTVTVSWYARARTRTADFRWDPAHRELTAVDGHASALGHVPDESHPPARRAPQPPETPATGKAPSARKALSARKKAPTRTAPAVRKAAPTRRAPAAGKASAAGKAVPAARSKPVAPRASKASAKTATPATTAAKPATAAARAKTVAASASASGQAAAGTAPTATKAAKPTGTRAAKPTATKAAKPTGKSPARTAKTATVSTPAARKAATPSGKSAAGTPAKAPAKPRLRVVPDPEPARPAPPRKATKGRSSVPDWADVLLGATPKPRARR